MINRRWGQSEIIQIAFVVSDIDAAVDYWSEQMGVGPFFGNTRTAESTYMGRPSRPEFTALMAYWGEVQVELVKQHNDAPSIYRDWKKGPFELHHVCIETTDIAKAEADILAQGGVIAQTNDLKGGAVFYAQVGEGPYLEVVQSPDYLKPVVARMKQAAREWDGVTDRVRPMSSLFS